MRLMSFINSSFMQFFFSAGILLSGLVLAWLSVWSAVQTCMWPSWCHCHSLTLASVKSRLVWPFWYRLTRVVPDQGPLNGCVCFTYFLTAKQKPIYLPFLLVNPGQLGLVKKPAMSCERSLICHSVFSDCIVFLMYMFVVAEHLLAQHNAVKMLHGRIRIILDYIKAVEAGMHWFRICCL